jgi:hypothetical protein
MCAHGAFRTLISVKITGVSPERTILDVKLQEANQLADNPDRRDLLAATDINHHLAE